MVSDVILGLLGLILTVTWIGITSISIYDHKRKPRTNVFNVASIPAYDTKLSLVDFISIGILVSGLIYSSIWEPSLTFMLAILLVSSLVGVYVMSFKHRVYTHTEILKFINDVEFNDVRIIGLTMSYSEKDPKCRKIRRHTKISNIVVENKTTKEMLNVPVRCGLIAVNNKLVKLY